MVHVKRRGQRQDELQDCQSKPSKDQSFDLIHASKVEGGVNVNVKD